MTTTSASSPAATGMRAPGYARALLLLNAIVAWAGVLLSFTMNITGAYLGDEDPSKPSILGNIPSGHDTPLERFLDWSTYFTIWSNITVAVVLTVLVARPELFARPDLVGGVWRALRLDSVLMITITGIVYNLLLAEGGKSGWDLVNNTLVHVLTPLLTVLVWLVAGPRGPLSLRVVAGAMVLPLVWAAYALIRGAVVGAYPYPFLDVSAKGLGPVLAFVAVIVVVAVVLALVLVALDRVLPPRAPRV